MHAHLVHESRTTDFYTHIVAMDTEAGVRFTNNSPLAEHVLLAYAVDFFSKFDVILTFDQCAYDIDDDEHFHYLTDTDRTPYIKTGSL